MAVVSPTAQWPNFVRIQICLVLSHSVLIGSRSCALGRVREERVFALVRAKREVSLLRRLLQVLAPWYFRSAYSIASGRPEELVW